MFAKVAVRRDFHLCGDGLVGDEVELEDLNARLVANDFLRVLQAITGETDLDLSAALSAGWQQRDKMRRGCLGAHRQEAAERQQNSAELRPRRLCDASRRCGGGPGWPWSSVFGAWPLPGAWPSG